MASSPEQIIAAVYPALSGSPSLPVFLEMAGNYINTQFARGFFGTTRNMAIAYAACHYFAVTAGNESDGSTAAAAGPIASKGEGGLSVSYAVTATTSDDSFGTTGYGKMFLELVASRKKVLITLGVNGGCRK
jgi:hypothetical protein